MRIPVESIPKADAIKAARDWLYICELAFGNGKMNIDNISITIGEFERIAKVLLVGIGELSK
jgi:hypothetical protein